MAVYTVFILSRGGSLIYDLDYIVPRTEVEQTFTFPLDIVLAASNGRLNVAFGARDGIREGYSLISINGQDLKGCSLENGASAQDYLANEQNYPLSLKFGVPKLSSNEKIRLSSMFHSFYAFGCELSPEEKSSGILLLEADSFKLHCKQTITGIKFIIVTDPRLGYVDGLLKSVYELYADFALKNPYYSIDMPIRSELFDENMKFALEQFEKSGVLQLQ